MTNRIEKVTLFRNDVVIKRKGGGVSPYRDIPTRGDVSFLSRKSLQRLAFVAMNTSATLDYMMTLTYPKEYARDGKVIKSHLNTFLTWARRKGIGSYLWFMEFQKRGAPHYHILHENRLDYREVSHRWYVVVGSNDAKHQEAGTRCEAIREENGAKHYALKYASKCSQKLVPKDYRNVGRFWGHSRDVKPEPLGELDITTYQELYKMLKGWSQRENVAERIGFLKVLYGASRPMLDNLEVEE